MGDRIELRGLRVVGVHGVCPEERERAQPFEIDIDIDTDLTAAGASDRLEDTIDYGALAHQAETVVRVESHLLLERVAARIAEELLRDERIDSVRVTVRKLRPPLALDLVSSGVTVTRRR